MLDFGFSEVLLTSVIALVVLGPERLPKVARQVGNWMGRARVMARQLSEQLDREVAAADVSKEIAKAKAAVNSLGSVDPLASSPTPPAASAHPQQPAPLPSEMAAGGPAAATPAAQPPAGEQPKPGHE
jgi:sec-independent protein translocase protein TatB